MGRLAMSLDHEPLKALFGILSRLQEDAYAITQVLFSGTHNAWAESVMTAVCDDTGKQSFFFDAPGDAAISEEKDRLTLMRRINSRINSGADATSSEYYP